MKNKDTCFVRDPMGITPLFYAQGKNGITTASHIKDMVKTVPAVLDANGVAELILLGPGRTPGCGVLSGIHEVKPGCFAYLNKQEVKQKAYWHLTDKKHTDDFSKTCQKVRQLVKKSAKEAFTEDKPFGTFLSGGLDSSILTSLASRYLKKSGAVLQTFSVDYADNDKHFKAGLFTPSEDKEYIDCMIQYLGCKNHRVILSQEALADALYDAVDARGLPGMADIDASLYLFCKEVKKQVDVAISGECADELFGGYPWFRKKEMLSYHGFPWSQNIEYRAGFLRPEWEINAKEFVQSRYQQTRSETVVLKELSAEEKRQREMMQLNYSWFMQTLLARNGCMSALAEIEVRAPFCNPDIAQYAYSIPQAIKDYNGMEKGLLREAFKEYLPQKVLYRKKSPYPKTHNPKYLELVAKRLTEEVLTDASAPLLQIVKKEALEDLLKPGHTIPWYGQLMNTPQTIAYFLQMNYWLKKFKIKIKKA